MSRYQHLHGALVASPPWDAPDACADCGHEFSGRDEQFEDPRENTVCKKCRAKYPCKVCGGEVPEEGEFCSEECEREDSRRGELDLEMDFNLRQRKGD